MISGESTSHRRRKIKKADRLFLSPQNDRDLFFEKVIPFPKDGLVDSSEFPFDYVVGIDEVGVACLAGPVVSCCFIYCVSSKKGSWVDETIPVPIFDSKNLSDTEKRQSELWLKNLDCCHRGFGEASPQEIDELNIYHATGLAMSRAFQNACDGPFFKDLEKARMLVLIDGNRVPKEIPRSASRFVVPIVKGDTLSFAIAAASILAKTSRDQLMASYSEDPQFSHYGWNTNVGYPTLAHKKAIQQNGLTELHRRSFRSEL